MEPETGPFNECSYLQSTSFRVTCWLGREYFASQFISSGWFSRLAVPKLRSASSRGSTSLLLGSSGDVVSRLSNGPFRACYGLLWGLVGDTNLAY